MGMSKQICTQRKRQRQRMHSLLSDNAIYNANFATMPILRKFHIFQSEIITLRVFTAKVALPKQCQLCNYTIYRVVLIPPLPKSLNIRLLHCHQFRADMPCVIFIEYKTNTIFRWNHLAGMLHFPTNVIG